jgi:hypothetical protein
MNASFAGLVMMVMMPAYYAAMMQVRVLLLRHAMAERYLMQRFGWHMQLMPAQKLPRHVLSHQVAGRPCCGERDCRSLFLVYLAE